MKSSRELPECHPQWIFSPETKRLTRQLFARDFRYIELNYEAIDKRIKERKRV